MLPNATVPPTPSLVLRVATLLAAALSLGTTFPLPGVSMGEMRSDEALERNLRARNPEAATIRWEGCIAYANRDMKTAEARFQEVRSLEPGWSHAARALAGVRMFQGKRQEALALAREAFTADPHPQNRAGLAMLLAWRSAGEPTAADLEEAMVLATGAADEAPNDFFV
jgi:tetratricopeptide (TPR) repeat protein